MLRRQAQHRWRGPSQCVQAGLPPGIKRASDAHSLRRLRGAPVGVVEPPPRGESQARDPFAGPVVYTAIDTAVDPKLGGNAVYRLLCRGLLRTA